MAVADAPVEVAAQSVFATYEPKAYPYVYAGELLVSTLAGGTPTNPQVAESWIKTKGGPDLKDALLAAEVAKVMEERGVDMDAAVEQVAENRHLCGFKRDGQGLYVDGRQLKACLKEAVSVAANSGKLPAEKWGTPTNANYKKGLKGWFPEHVFVVEQRLYTGRHEPDEVLQQFVHTRFGSGIQYSEIVEDVSIPFTIETDYEFPDEQWALIWLTAQRQGLGAMRSQGYGRFVVKKWEQLS